MIDIINAFLHGLGRPLILWLLSQGPRHGYELIKEVRRLTEQKLEPGMVHPFLHWLEDEGFAVSEWVKRSGRNLGCYRLTEKGENMFTKLRDFFSKPIREVITDLLSAQKDKWVHKPSIFPTST